MVSVGRQPPWTGLALHLVLSRSLEEFHKNAIEIFEQEMLAARPYDNIVAET